MQPSSSSASYKWLSPREHALERPDTYVGSVAPTEIVAHTFELDGKSVVRRDVKVVASPALLKVSDEVIVNAIDNHRRDETQKCIKLTFGEDGVFSVFNDGRPIPVALWEGTARHIPEILFGELLSGENFDDSKKRDVGGRNGIGIKIANILSEWFAVELVNLGDNVIFHNVGEAKAKLLSKLHPDQEAAKALFDAAEPLKAAGGLAFLYAKDDGVCDEDTLIRVGGKVYRNVGPLKYTQRFEQNLAVTRPPALSKPTEKASSTYVRWKVDLARLGMEDRLGADVLSVLRTRAFDAAACTGARLSIHVDGAKVPFKGIREYACAVGGAWIGRDTATNEDTGAVLDVCVLDAPDEATAGCVGFVNGLRCSSGTHVELVYKKLAEAVGDQLGKRLKRAVAIQSAQLKKKLVVVVAAIILNPQFSSQTKEKLDTRAERFGVSYVCSAATVKGFERVGLIDRLGEAVAAQEERMLQKSIKTDRVRVAAIPKYERALKLQSKQPCALYITEGDSAKALAVAGFSVIGRDHNGVFPLRGKLVNVHGMSAKKALEHKEIKHLTQILGLDPHASYTKESSLALPYRHLVIFVDQDHDGSHIMGLVLAWLHEFYKSLLLALPDFVLRFATPIIRARVGGETRQFFSEVEYRAWIGERKPTDVKYFKGLGTSDTEDAKRYFRAIDAHRIVVRYSGEADSSAIDTFFDAKRSEDRRRALSHIDVDSHIDYGRGEATCSEFCFKELIHFGRADCIRSLASAIDGLKPSQRKVLFTCLHRKPGETKVAQLGAIASEKTAYHHGEQSIMLAMVMMAQTWMGANNVALLKPNGMFGSRHMVRQEHAAVRYIFTEKHPIARLIFPVEDDAVLAKNCDDGKEIEPRVFCPIIPFLLVNGSEGIGTGWRGACPAYSPLSIIENTRRLVDDPGAALSPMTPWYFGFTGRTVVEGDHCTFYGTYTLEGDNCVRITELPPKEWTGPYVEWLRERLVGDGADRFLLEVTDSSTTDRVNLRLRTKADANLESRDLVRDLRLSKRVELRKLNFFDAEQNLKGYASVEEIMREHAAFRRQLYEERIAQQLQHLNHELQIAVNRVRFIRAIRDETVQPTRMSLPELRDWLRAENYYEHERFEYLQVGLFALTTDLARKLEDEAAKLQETMDELKASGVEQIWKAELDRLETGVREYQSAVDARRIEEGDTGKKRREKPPSGASKKKKAGAA